MRNTTRFCTGELVRNICSVAMTAILLFGFGSKCSAQFGGENMICGNVFLDGDCDGVNDPGELGINGVTVNLYDSHGNLLAQAITGPNTMGTHFLERKTGFFDFMGLIDGVYTIQVVVPDGYSPTGAWSEGNGGPGGYGTPLNLTTIQVDATHPPRMMYSTQNFLICPSSGINSLNIDSICGFVYTDSNCNGVVDSGDVGLNGVVVTLFDSSGNQIVQTQTDDTDLFTNPAQQTGYFCFGALGPGKYRVVMTLPTGYVSSGASSDGNGGPPGYGTVIDVRTIEVDTNHSGVVNYGLENFLVCSLPGNGATRTIGFWATHPQALMNAINQGGINLGACAPSTIGELEAIFWGNMAKQGGTARSALGKARMQLAQQLIAGQANQSLLGTSPGFSLGDAVAALNGTDVSLIQSYASRLDTFNNSGDPVSLSGQQIPLVGNTSADPKMAKSLANTTNGVFDPGSCFL